MFLPEPERMERDQNLGKPPSQIQRNDLKRYRCTEGKWSWDKTEARKHWPIKFSAPKSADQTRKTLEAQNGVDKQTLIPSEELAA